METARDNKPHTAQRGLFGAAALALLLTLAHLVNDAITSMLNTLLPSLQVRYGLSTAMLALLVATLSFSSSVTQPFFGAISDRLGRRPLAAFGLVLSVSLLSLMTVVPSVWTLFAVLLIGGLGSAAFHPSGNSIARSWTERKELAVSLFSAGGMLGLALGPVLVLLLASTLGLGFTPWLMAPGILLGLVIQLVAPQQPRPEHESGVKLFDFRLFQGPVGLLAVAGTLMEVAFATFTASIPLWLVSTHNVATDAPVIGVTLTIFYVAAALGGLVAGWLGHSLARRSIVLTALLLAPLPLLALFALEPGSAVFYAVVALSGLLVNAAFPLLIVSAQDLAPDAAATAAGMLGGLSVGAAGILYVGVGALQDLLGLQPAMTLSYLLLVPSGFLAYIVLRRHPKVDKPLRNDHEPRSGSVFQHESQGSKP